MANTIAAEEGALKDGATAVDTAHSGIDGRVKNVGGEADGLDAIWDGPAADAYLRLVRSWIEEANKINRILTDLSDGLTGSESDRAAREDENITTISGLGSMMGS